MEHNLNLPYGNHTHEIIPHTENDHVHNLEMGSFNFSTYVPPTPIINVTMTQEQLDYIIQKIIDGLNPKRPPCAGYLCRALDDDLK